MHTGTRFARVSARVLTRARARRRLGAAGDRVVGAGEGHVPVFNGFTHSVAARSDAALCPVSLSCAAL